MSLFPVLLKNLLAGNLQMIWKEMGRNMQIKQSMTWAPELLHAWNSPDEDLRYQEKLNPRNAAGGQEKTGLESLQPWCRQ